jgi:hypothetical protein
VNPYVFAPGVGLFLVIVSAEKYKGGKTKPSKADARGKEEAATLGFEIQEISSDYGRKQRRNF